MKNIMVKRACTKAPINTVTNVLHTSATPRLWEILRKEIHVQRYRIDCDAGAALVLKKSVGYKFPS